MPGLRKALGNTSALGVLKNLQENDARGVEEALQAAAETEVLEAYTNGETLGTSGDLEDHAPETAEDADLHAEILEGSGLASLATPDALRFVDDFAALHYGLDDETAQYLVDKRVAALWEAYTNTGVDALDALEGEGGYYFELIRERFRAELEGALNLPTPEGWSFRPPGVEAGPPVPPNLMQCRTAHALATRKRLGNWSGVGSGKTLAGILASRVTDRQHTLVICNNATVAGWLREIRNAFPDSVARSSVGGPVIGARLYTVLNYEKFQQANRRALVEDLVALEVDAVILDEVQFVKQRDSKVSARREAVHALLSELETRNPDLHVLGMSATPVINTLMEARRLVEIVTGRAFPDLDVQATVNNALAMHRTLMIHGLRYRPRYDIETTTEAPEATRNDLADELRAGEGVLHLERTLLPAKLETIREHIRPGTLIYTHYVHGMVSQIRAHVEALGYRAGLYTGEDKTGLEDFLAGRVDVLIGSKPVGTGLDGLQTRCNQIVMLSLPWTSAEYEQIIGRVRRQGSAFGSVRVVVPQVNLEHEGDVWSWDGRRMDTIRFKRTLSDCALDGTIPEVARISPKELEERGRKALEAWIERVRGGEAAIGVERPWLHIPLPPALKERLKVQRGDFATLNNRWVSSNSETVHTRLKEDPAEWYLYHTLYREARKEWSEVPAEIIASHLRSRPDLIVGDFGCGECLLAEALGENHQVIGFDHVAANATVTACDMAHTPLEDEALGAAVFSLSLMGRNWRDYLTEAHRALQPFGLLFIAEPAKRWEDGSLERAVEEAGFDLLPSRRRGDFLYVRAVKS
jgi:superfamily II DNA or RNA helicase